MRMKLLHISLLTALVMLGALLPTPALASSTVGQVVAPLTWTEHTNYYSVYNGQFTIQFYKGSTGYDKFYNPDGSVAIYDNRVTLEYLQGTNWKQRGVPTGVDLQDNKDSLVVTRHYTDYLSTTYDVAYTVEAGEPIKITITLHSGQTDTYRLVWSPSGIAGEGSYNVYQLDFDSVALNWADVRHSLGNITTYNLTDTAQGRKAEIIFDIGAVAAGKELVIDPSVVGTTTGFVVFASQAQRRTFYAEGKHWVFYSDGTDILWDTSSDGSSWDGASTLVSPATAGYSDGYYWAMFFDGTYVHYVRYDNPAGTSTILYRRGDPESDGTITWSAAEQSITTGFSADSFQVIADSEGYPWISCYNSSGSRIRVYKSSVNDGTWTTQGGFPYEPVANNHHGSYLTPLTGGDVYVAYLRGSFDDAKGELWDGGTDTWQGAETITSKDPEVYGGGSITSEGDIVYFVMLEESEDIYLEERSAVGVWTETLIYNGTSTTSRPAICLIGSGDLRVVWCGDTDADHIYYKERISSAWDGAATDWIDASGDSLTTNYGFSIYFEEYSTVMGIAYEEDAGGPPYNIVYEFMGSPVSEPTVTSSAADNITTTGADLHGTISDNGGSVVTTVGFEWDTDSGAPYANDWHTAYSADNFSHTFSTMPPDTTIYWRAYATNGVGTGYSAERNFNTLLPYPLPPTGFTSTQTGTNSITLDWTTGTYATSTIIRGAVGEYPVDITDGYEVYNGALETVDLDGLNLNTDTYYYRAWSNNATGNSLTTADLEVGGEAMIFLCLLFGAIGLTAVGYTKQLMPISYGGGGMWAIFMGYCYQHATSIAFNTGTWDTYGMLFWIAMGMLLLCMLEPVIQRKPKGLAEETAVAVDEYELGIQEFKKNREDMTRARSIMLEGKRPITRKRSKYRQAQIQ